MEVKFKKLNNIYMQKKRSISQKQTSTSKKKTIPQKKKQQCQLCTIPSGYNMLVMQKSLYRKYSFTHFSEPQIIDSCIKHANINRQNMHKEYLQKYYKTLNRKHQFPRIKQIYKLHHESPRLFMNGIKDIINKCQHRKRLLQYFKLAKILGIRVDTIKFSTFMLSLSKSQHPLIKKKQGFDPLIGQISGYQFSEQVQRQLIQTLQGQENNINLNNPENIYHQAKKYQQTTTSFNQLRLK